MITANQFRKCTLGQFELMRDVGILARLIKAGIYLSLAPRHNRIPIFRDEEPLKAYVNHGRWVVKCECGGAEKAWEEGKFMCLSCLNSSHKHKYRVSVFPESRKTIEAILCRRPLMNRNWFPGETVAQLQKENKDHQGELL